MRGERGSVKGGKPSGDQTSALPQWETPGRLGFAVGGRKSAGLAAQAPEEFRTRTDLAVEAREMLAPPGVPQEIPGVRVENLDSPGIHVTRVWIQDAAAGERLGKVPGRYVTLEIPDLPTRNPELTNQASDILSRELQNLVQLQPDQTVMVVGLGNWNVTPDSLGPKVIHNLVITRHLLQLIPEEVEEGVRPVCGLAPGVLGLTGIETGEIILGVIDRVKPDLLVAVDALAARSIERVCTTIQLSDSGIHPGSGVGNNRLGITREVLGIPVIAVGVPTVVEGATIALDTIELLLERLRGSGAAFDLKAIQGFDRRERDLLIREVLSPYSANLVVTPKEIDTLIEEVSTLIAGGLNAAFHPSIDPENLAMYTN